MGRDVMQSRIALVVSPAVGTERYKTVSEARNRAIRLSLQPNVGYAKVVSPSGHTFGFVRGCEAECVNAMWVKKPGATLLMDPCNV